MSHQPNSASLTLPLNQPISPHASNLMGSEPKSESSATHRKSSPFTELISQLRRMASRLAILILIMRTFYVIEMGAEKGIVMKHIATSLLLGICFLLGGGESSAQTDVPMSNPASPYYHTVYLPSIGEGDTIRPVSGQVDDTYVPEFVKPKNRTGWTATFYAIAITRDSKAASTSNSADIDSYGFRTEKEAAESAIKTCERERNRPCVLVASLPNACFSTTNGNDGIAYVGYAPLPLPDFMERNPKISEAREIGKKAAIAASQAECKRKTSGACSGASNIGCSNLHFTHK